jgi:short-subunit dehydrogenase
MRVFITGASSGIGEGLARHYGQAGASIGLLARRRELLEGLARGLREAGASVEIYPVDVADTAAVQQAIDAFLASAGGADLVIANAGVTMENSLERGDAASAARLMAINVIGVTNVIIPFIPVMARQNAGTLVAISSVAGFRGLPGRAAYSASKAAVTTFMEGVRMSLHGTGVHAMAICPGYVRTPMTAELRSPPFVLQVDEAVRLMTRAIAAKRTRYVLPWQMSVLKHVLRGAPEWVVRRMIPASRTRGTL